MLLSDLASLGSFVSGLAVLVSLIYLALQVRQAEKNQQSSIRLARTTRGVDIVLRTTDSAICEASMAVTTGAGTDIQWLQFFTVISASISHLEDSFFQFRSGLLPGDAFRTFTAQVKSSLARPEVRAFWDTTLRSRFDTEFAAFVDSLIQETPLSLMRYHEMVSVWKNRTEAIRTAATA